MPNTRIGCALSALVMGAGMVGLAGQAEARDCGAFAHFQDGNSYNAGDQLVYNGGLYRALITYTAYAGAGWTPDVASLWTYVDSCSSGGNNNGGDNADNGDNNGNPGSGSGGEPGDSGNSGNSDNYASWQSGHNYQVGDVVSYNGNLYVATHRNPGYSPTVSTWFWDVYTADNGGNQGGNGGSDSGDEQGNTGGDNGNSGNNGDLPGTAEDFIFSPYKDITINMNWNTNVISTKVAGSAEPVLSVVPSGVKTMTWAFATGECGSENWAGLRPQMVADANISRFVDAGVNYVISTGGANGSFTCGSDAGFDAFIDTYKSSRLVGVDFDIEAGQSQSDINNLVQRAIHAQSRYPGLRFSFTLATLGGNAPQSFGAAGIKTMSAIKAYGLQDYTINLMTMDYGSTRAGNCTIGSDGLCDMGESAVQAAVHLHDYYNVPYSQISITPMIGGNDTRDETFRMEDVDTVVNFVRQNGLAGIHYWSLDRDRDCAPGYAQTTCNSYGQAGTLGFTRRFLDRLGL